MYRVKEFQCHCNHHFNCWTENTKQNKNKKQTNNSRYLNVYFSEVVALTHDTFTQLDLPTQDLPPWLVDVGQPT